MNYQERDRAFLELMRQKAKEEKERDEAEMKKLGIVGQQPTKPKFDHPDSLENDEATVIWIVVMIVGSIFNGNWIIWILATIIWFTYINRHN